MTEPVLDFIVTFIFVIGNAVLATFVALRAWEHRPARVFVIVVALLVTTAISIYGQAIFTSPDTLYLLRSLHIIQVGVVSSAFILLLTAIFMPVWWEGRRPIRWIMLPYLLFSVWLAVDLLAQRGVFVAGLNITETDITFKVTHMGRLLMVAFSLSWLMPLVMLITTFMRDHQARIPILVLGGSIVLSLALNSVRLFLSPSPVLRGMILLTPLPLALAHVVFRTRMITPLRAAIDQAFETMSDVAIVLDTADQISYANGRALDRGFQLHADFATALRSINPALETADTFLTGAASQRLQLSGRQLVVSRSTLVDTHGQRVGTLVLGRDVTEIEERTLQLEQERAHLASLVRELEAEQQERAALAATVQALAMPVIPILDGVLVLPLVGVFDRERMSELRILMLKAVERLSARIVMLDLTGLSFLDEIGAVGLTRSIQAARLLGAECMLVGVRPEIAEAIVAQGLVIEDIPTAATLQEAVRRVLVPTRNITL